MRSIAHMNLHQEETRTPQGVHCPEACLPSQRGHHPWCPKPITAECCTCLPVCHSCHTPLGQSHSCPLNLGSRNQSLYKVPQGNGSFGCSVNLPLGSRPADPHSTAVGVETCSTPVLNRTQQGCSALHSMEYSLLQPRSAPEDTPVGGNPGLICNLPCPFYTADALLGCPQQRWTVRQS